MAKDATGVITEQGDLGLGYTPFSESERQTVRKETQEANKEKKN